jgi:predicted RNase H-like nuclease (RuvC/YqgF family)
MMTIEEAIAHCLEKASAAEDINICQNEHYQLANWLQELRNMKDFKKDYDKILLENKALKAKTWRLKQNAKKLKEQLEANASSHYNPFSET